MKTKVKAQRHKVAKAQSTSVPLCLCAFVPLYLCLTLTRGAFASGVEIDDGAGGGLIGRWTFDDLTDGVLKDSARTALDTTVRGDVSLEDGVFAAAARFSRQQAIRIKTNEAFRNLPAITISAWVSPRELSGYREILRKEDADRRILFSFQNNGRILSLGLNVAGSGYEELDARVRPASLTDLQWHHVAGTFDGEKMRVYLDGLEIGSKRKPGRIVSGGDADAFIGSHAGRSEFFQGLMDDLRIYNISLTGDQVASLYEDGLSAIGAKVEGYREQVQEVYEDRATFAETMAATRRNLKDKDVPRVLMRLIQAKLTARFSSECADFSEATNSQPFEYLTAADNSWNLNKAEHLIGLVTEYKPLTQQQWAKLNETQREEWKDVEQLTTRLEQLKKMEEAGTCEADWIELMLEAAARVVRRPVQYEAVAPCVKPYTPRTRDYSAQEAQDILKRDWLHQADGAVTAQHIKSEIGWTRAVAARIKRNYPDKVDFSSELSELRALEAGMGDSSDEQLFYAVRSIKRGIMFADPAVDFDSLLFIDIPFPGGSEWPHETRHRLGYMAVPGGRLLTLKGLSPKGHLTELMPTEPLHGTFWRPDLSFDAKRVLLSFHPANEKNFHLYEINIDGSGLRQITEGIYDDVDPIYLPDDEHIIFASTRGHNYVRCMPPTNSFVLTRCDLYGRNMYIISRNNVYHNSPAGLKGKASYLRILTMDAKTYSYWYKRPYASTGPVVSMVSSEGVKRILGTVPIESDGSVHFKAPSGKSLYFQLLDEKYRALQTMRSISGVMPGETRGCLGCHEMHSTTPPTQTNAEALQRGPSEITAPPWGDESISYMRFVQPVLDKYCGDCHQGEGEARDKLDLTYRGDGLFKEPYVLLIGNPSWGAAYHPPDNPPAGFGVADTILVEAYDQRDPAAYVTPEPMTKLSYKSRLVDIASSGKHNDVKVDELSRRKLIAWVDTMCPYRGDREVRQIDDPEFQGIDWLAIRPQIKNAPVVVRPGPIDSGP